MSLIHYQNENFEELLKGEIVLVDFYADWCGPCKMIAPVLEEFATMRKEVNVVKVNVDAHEDIARRFGITSIPTLHLYKSGALVSQKLGFQTIEMLSEWIESAK